MSPTPFFKKVEISLLVADEEARQIQSIVAGLQIESAMWQGLQTALRNWADS